MDEPPIISNEPPDPREPPEVNPYAASASSPPSAGSIRLSRDYWIVLAMAIFVFGLLCYLAPGLGVPAMTATIAAAVRVPLLQRRFRTQYTDRQISRPLILLCTSWLFCLAMSAAASIAFVVICIPAGLASIAIANGEDTAIAVAFGLSALLALAAYILLFIVSLRLPI